MKLIFNTEECEKSNIPLDTLCYLLSLYLKSPIKNRSYEKAFENGWIMIDEYSEDLSPKTLHITKEGVDFIESLFLNSEFKSTGEENYEDIAESLRELFPKGKKPGTTLMWRGSSLEVVKKLKTLKKKTGIKFNKEVVIEATKKYIESFNGNYNYMQILPYFILKQVPVNGVYEEKSQLLSFIENKDGDTTTNSEWTAELR